MTLDDIRCVDDDQGRPAYWYMHGHVDRAQMAGILAAHRCPLNAREMFGEHVHGVHGWIKRIPCQGGAWLYDLRMESAPGFEPVTAISA